MIKKNHQLTTKFHYTGRSFQYLRYHHQQPKVKSSKRTTSDRFLSREWTLRSSTALYCCGLCLGLLSLGNKCIFLLKGIDFLIKFSKTRNCHLNSLFNGVNETWAIKCLSGIFAKSITKKNDTYRNFCAVRNIFITPFWFFSEIIDINIKISSDPPLLIKWYENLKIRSAES